jgi:hypothetical protein
MSQNSCNVSHKWVHKKKTASRKYVLLVIISDFQNPGNNLSHFF